MNHEKCIRSKRKKMPLNSQQSLYVSEHIMICQNQSCSLYVCVWLFVCVNCYPTLFPLQNNSSRVTTATAGIHYSMNAVTTHPHIKHPRWASSLCAQMENPTLLAPRCFGSGTLRHRPENSPNTKSKADVMRWKTRTAHTWWPHHLSILSLQLCLTVFYLLTQMNVTHFYSVNLCFI